MPNIVLNVTTAEDKRNSKSIMRGTPWGNPYIIGADGNREEVIAKFEEYARWRLRKEPEWLDKLRDKNLLCICKPEACHGDVIVKLLKERELELLRKKRIKYEATR